MEMHKLPTFTQWLTENLDAGPDPARLMELGLWQGPVLEWRVDVGRMTIWGGSPPPIGKWWVTREWGNEDTRIGYELFPTSFRDSEPIMQMLEALWKREGSQAALISWCSDHLRELFDHYPHQWRRELNDPLPALCLTTGVWTTVPAEVHTDPRPLAAGEDDDDDPGYIMASLDKKAYPGG